MLTEQVNEPAKELSRHTFFQGLLLAARAAGAADDFLADGRAFHDAFAAVVEQLRAPDAPFIKGLDAALVKRDPVFGVFHEANAMLFQGEQDLILGLGNPTLRRAHFKVSSDDADDELDSFALADWLRRLGRVLASGLIK